MTDEGYCSVCERDSGCEWRLPRAEYPRILAEWMAGAAFIATVTRFGAPITLKAALIVSVADQSPDAIQRFADHEAEERQSNILHGTDA